MSVAESPPEAEPSTPAEPVLWWTLAEFLELAGLSWSMGYQLRKDGKLNVATVGRRLFVPVPEGRRFIDAQAAEGHAADAARFAEHRSAMAKGQQSDTS